MDEHTALSRILEVENLTDELDDDQADLLLDWARKNLAGVLTGITDEEVAGERLNALMSVMRKINSLSAAVKSRPPDRLEPDLNHLDELVCNAFGISASDAVPAAKVQAISLKSIGTQAVVQALIDRVDAVRASKAPLGEEKFPEDGANPATPPDSTSSP